MDKSYSSFGLALGSPFPLAGMKPVGAEGLPFLRLVRETPAELWEAWGGVDGGSWRGQLSDGNELAVEQGPGGLLFSFGESAWFHLDPTRERLGCASLDPDQLDWQRVLVDRVLPLVSLARGREALHAAAVETPLGVVAIAAGSGSGKSTLAAELMRRGHRFFCDDILVLDGAGGAIAHPGAPHMNLDLPGVSAVSAELPALASTLGILADERWVEVAANAAHEPRRVAAIVLFERATGLSLQARRLPASPLTLVPLMLGLPDEVREAATFAVYSDLVDSAVLLELSGDVDDSPAEFAAALEAAIGLEVAAAERSAA